MESPQTPVPDDEAPVVGQQAEPADTSGSRRDLEKLDADREELEKLGAGFERMLQEGDEQRLDAKAKGPALTPIWRECLRVHNDNVVLRKNMLQLHVMLEQELFNWIQVKQRTSKALHDIEANDLFTAEHKGDLSAADKIRRLIELNQGAAKIVREINETITKVRKEVRQSEFQSRFTLHINVLQMLLTGLHGILWKHLRDSGLYGKISSDITRLARTIDITEETQP